jgi:hypothetical protein
MSNTSDSVLAEVLKLYDMVDEQKIPNKVQLINVIVSDNANMGNSNVFPCEQYVKHNEASVVPCSESSVVDNDVMHEQRIPDEIQQTNVAELDIANMGNSNVVPYEQYVKHNAKFVVSSDASSVDDNVCELDEYTAVSPDDTLTTRINILKDQVRCYENVQNLS